MKRFSGILIGALAMLLILGIAPKAHALTMQLSNNGGSTWTVINDNGVGDLSPDLGRIQYSGSLGVFSFVLNLAETKPVLGTAQTPELHFSASSFSSTGPGTLLIEVTDTGYGPVPAGSTTGFDTAVGGSSNGYLTFGLKTYLDGSNTAFGTSTLLADLGPFTTGYYSGGQLTSVAPTGNFSLTSIATVTSTVSGLDARRGSGSIDMNLQPVPEPSTFVLLGIGLFGAAFLRQRFRAR